MTSALRGASVTRWLVKANNAAYLVAAFIVGAWAWMVVSSLFQGAGHSGGLWLVALLICPFPCALIHELGHAAFAKVAGWRVALIHVAPFSWRPSDGRFAVVGAPGGQDFAGYCAIMPGSGAATRGGYILGVLGGPIASAVLAVLAALAAIAFLDAYNNTGGGLTPVPRSDGTMALRIEPERQSLDRAITPFFAALSALSAYAAVFSLWPARFKRFYNDGALIVDALTGRVETRNAYAWINVAMAEGVSPRHWPAWTVAAVKAAMDKDNPPSGAAMFALFLAVDSAPMDAAAARKAIESIKASDAWKDERIRDWLLPWDAIVAALLEGDADRAQSSYDQIDLERFGSTADALAARAAIAARRREVPAIHEALAAFRNELARQPMRASAWNRLASAIQHSAA
jgi:hypothetical protein